ncbi:hypothetical protein SAMN02746009_00931 [Hymenobacter psychrotolerans DSM 18569]|uniref:Uncharacterized protein n=1 Tax=Hymenobacter psychrotolerans DSM 18569 TaxID=1121959 RepID=A0A1M6SNK1_9BACT|nr:hypothetical protein SAMN02746009_00931 [Hymenobacter psychrotolerans DSM 18569]
MTFFYNSQTRSYIYQIIVRVRRLVHSHRLQLVQGYLLLPVFAEGHVLLHYLVATEHRPTGGRRQAGKPHSAGTLTEVPEVHCVAFEQHVRPRVPEAVVVVMVGRLDAGQLLTLWRPKGVNKAAAPESRVHSGRRIGRFVVVLQQFPVAGQQQQRPVCMPGLACGRRSSRSTLHQLVRAPARLA